MTNYFLFGLLEEYAHAHWKCDPECGRTIRPVVIAATSVHRSRDLIQAKTLYPVVTGTKERAGPDVDLADSSRYDGHPICGRIFPKQI
jgi:hypothetical protein